MEIIDRTTAKKRGEKLYYDGRYCRNGHRAMRFTSTYVCVQCRAEQNERQAERLGRRANIRVTYKIDARDERTLNEFANALILARKLTL